MKHYLVFVVFGLCLTAFLRAEAGQPPATLSVEGRAPLTLAALATRRDLLGAVELYTIALYTDGTAASHDSVRGDQAVASGSLMRARAGHRMGGPARLRLPIARRWSPQLAE